MLIEGAGAVFRAVLEVDAVRLAVLNLLEALGLVAGALGALIPLIETAIRAGMSAIYSQWTI